MALKFESVKRDSDGVVFVYGPATWTKVGTAEDPAAQELLGFLRAEERLVTRTELKNARQVDLLCYAITGSTEGTK